jgi:hypothetical protein
VSCPITIFKVALDFYTQLSLLVKKLQAPSYGAPKYDTQITNPPEADLLFVL